MSINALRWRCDHALFEMFQDWNCNSSLLLSYQPQLIINISLATCRRHQQRLEKEIMDELLNQTNETFIRLRRGRTLCVDIVAMICAFFGFLCVAVITGLPRWKLTVRSESWTEYEGLWTKCYFIHDASSLTCKAYLDPALWSARYFETLSLVLAVAAWISSLMSIQCTRPDSARRCLVRALCLHLLASLTNLIPVSWTALSILHADRGLSSIRFHMGEALFVGWLASCLLCTAGLLQCCSGPFIRAGEETSIAESSSHSGISLDTLFSSASLDSHANACISEIKKKVGNSRVF